MLRLARTCEKTEVSAAPAGAAGGGNLLNAGHNLLNVGHNLLNLGRNLLKFGHDLLKLGITW